MRTTWNLFNKKTKFIFLLTLTFLFSGSIYGEKPEVYKEYWDNGKLKKETHYKDEKLEGVETQWWKNGKKSSETHWKNDKRE